jgi:hypothetical protein
MPSGLAIAFSFAINLLNKLKVGCAVVKAYCLKKSRLSEKLCGFVIIKL